MSPHDNAMRRFVTTATSGGMKLVSTANNIVPRARCQESHCTLLHVCAVESTHATRRCRTQSLHAMCFVFSTVSSSRTASASAHIAVHCAASVISGARERRLRVIDVWRFDAQRFDAQRFNERHFDAECFSEQRVDERE